MPGSPRMASFHRVNQGLPALMMRMTAVTAMMGVMGGPRRVAGGRELVVAGPNLTIAECLKTQSSVVRSGVGASPGP